MQNEFRKIRFVNGFRDVGLSIRNNKNSNIIPHFQKNIVEGKEKDGHGIGQDWMDRMAKELSPIHFIVINALTLMLLCGFHPISLGVSSFRKIR